MCVCMYYTYTCAWHRERNIERGKEGDVVLVYIYVRRYIQRGCAAFVMRHNALTRGVHKRERERRLKSPLLCCASICVMSDRTRVI